jgi:hypothetical protein
VVGIDLAFGVLGPGPQVGAQLLAVAGSVSAEPGQHRLSSARTRSARAACSAACARAVSCWASWVACSACAAWATVWSRPASAARICWLASARACSTAASRSASALAIRVAASRRLADCGVAIGFGGGAGCFSLVGAGLGGVHPRGHLLRGGLGIGAPLAGFGGALLGGGRAGFGGGRALLGSRADGFHLGFSGGRVGHRLDGLAQPVGDAGNSVGLGAQRAQQIHAGHPGHRHGAVSVGRAGDGAGLRGGQVAALAPGRDLGVPASFAVLGRAARPGRRGCGLAAARART